MSGTSFELVLLLGIAALAGVGALFAALCFFRMRPQAAALTEQTAGRILRSETDIVRAAVEDQARGLRQELGRTLTGFQEVTLIPTNGRDHKRGNFNITIGSCPTKGMATQKRLTLFSGSRNVSGS